MFELRNLPSVLSMTLISTALFLVGCDDLLGGLPSCVEDDCNCSDFTYQEEAQQVLDAFEGDPHSIDKDGNGVACESLPRGSKVAALSGDSHLPFGNPSGANASNLNNLLMEKEQYALGYSCDRGIANWVAWQLNTDWFGPAERADNFRPDPDLPAGCPVVTSRDYRGSGFDRGHLAPSADRTRSPADNSATFFMTNMMPQAPANNREVWRELEEYSRDLVFEGHQLYITAGGEGEQGRLAGKVTVPTHTWKIILVLDQANPTVTPATRVIAVRIPNDESVDNTQWQNYTVSVDTLESKTGLDFFPALPTSLQRAIESKVD